MAINRVSSVINTPRLSAMGGECVTHEAAGCVWLLLCACSRYEEDDLPGLGGETLFDLEQAYAVKSQDIHWVTPVLEEHFTYYSSVMAGGWKLSRL